MYFQSCIYLNKFESFIAVQFEQSERLECLTLDSGIDICRTVSSVQKRSQPSAFQKFWHRDLSGTFSKFLLVELNITFCNLIF